MRSTQEIDAAFATGFLDELEKLSAAAPQSEDRNYGKFFLVGTGGVLGSQIATGLSTPMVLSMNRTSVSGLNHKKLMKAMGVDPSKITFKEGPAPAARIEFNPKGGYVVFGPKGSETIAHELGHASNFRTPGRLSAWMAGRKFGPAAGLIGAGYLSGSNDPDTRKWVPAAAAAGMVPTLTDEAFASAKALKGMRALGVHGPQLRGAMKNLGKGFGSYAASAAGMAGGAYLASKLMNRDNK